MTSATTTKRTVRIAAAAGLTLLVGALGLPQVYAAPAAGTSTASATAARVATTATSKITITRAAKNTVRISWPKRSGASSYVVIAAGGVGEIASVTTRLTTATVSDLKPATRYTFIVTPMKGSAALKPMRAVMAHPLNATSTTDAGAATTSAFAADDGTTDPTTTDSTAADEPVVTPAAPSNPSRPAPSPVAPQPPRTVTVWECPVDFVEQPDGTCLQARAYTFHEVITMQAYTFHSGWVQTGPMAFVDLGAPDAWGTCSGRGHLVGDRCGVYDAPGHAVTVKDDVPTGFTDDGSQWVRVDTFKDDAPAGFTDDGMQWVRTAAKVSREVPA